MIRKSRLCHKAQPAQRTKRLMDEKNDNLAEQFGFVLWGMDIIHDLAVRRI